MFARRKTSTVRRFRRKSLPVAASLVLMVMALAALPAPARPSPGAPAQCAFSLTKIGGRPPGCPRTLWSRVPSRTFRTGEFIISWSNCLFRGPRLVFSNSRDPGKAVWETLRGESFVSAAAGEASVRESRGSFKITDRLLDHRRHQTVDSIREKDGAVVIAGSFPGAPERLSYSMRLKARGAGRLDFRVRLKGPGADGGAFNRLFLTYASGRDERFFGFGAQYSHFDLKGRKVPVLSQEQGIGRGLQPLTFLMDLFAGSGGGWSSTYTAVPHYITSRCRSLFLKNTEFCEFDMTVPDSVRVKLFSPVMKGGILSGGTPLELIESYTAYAGRMDPLPGWLNSGAVVGMQGGTARVLSMLETLRSYDVPVAAFWLQDWVGKRRTIAGSQLWWNWEVDENAYPGWADMVASLREQGVRVMAYLNPYLVDVSDKPGHHRNLFEEARARGYLVKDRDGGIYRVTNTSFQAGIVDLTNPEARAWLKGVIKGELLAKGVSGWMADYGEALPFDCVLSGGQDPASYHNRFPEEWAALNREAVSESGLEGDVVFFSRSGSARSPGLATLFWLGDQLVSWDGYDGIKTAVVGLLSSGVSGYSLNHSDIGGYTTIGLSMLPGFGVFRTRELLLRWMELNAFTAVFRTHEGNVPEINCQFYTDGGTLAQFARFAKVYGALAPYRQRLMEEASRSGYPLVRHPFLHFPDDPGVYSLRDQFMLGSEFMVAPVLDPGREEVDVYLPAGRWVLVWTGAVFGTESAGSRVKVPAPVGRPAVLYREGSPAGVELVEELERMGLL